MKTSLLILKIIVLGLIGLGALALFWVYVVPGIVLGFLRLDQRHKWLPGVTALFIVGILRFSTGTWQIKFGDMDPGPWYVQCAAGLLQWAVASILVSAGCRIPQYFMNGFLNPSNPKPT
jgi:hypothetical protein